MVVDKWAVKTNAIDGVYGIYSKELALKTVEFLNHSTNVDYFYEPYDPRGEWLAEQGFTREKVSEFLKIVEP